MNPNIDYDSHDSAAEELAEAIRDGEVEVR